MNDHLARATAAVLAAAAIPAMPGCGSHSLAGTATSSHTAVSQAVESGTISPDELAKMWNIHPLPCPNPVSIGGVPDDPYNLLENAYWPDDADVARQLQGVTAHGGQEFVTGRLQFLSLVVFETQSDIAHRVERGTAAIEAGRPPTREQSQHTIELQHNDYEAAVGNAINELRAGHSILDDKIAQRYPRERVCPDG